MAKFETKVCLVDKYDEVVCELEVEDLLNEINQKFSKTSYK